jgi:hypothetical protein
MSGVDDERGEVYRKYDARAAFENYENYSWLDLLLQASCWGGVVGGVARINP